MDLSRLAKDLKPYISPWITAAVAGVGGGGGGGGAVVGAHSLDGAFHTGVLGNSQAPQFPLLAGGRTYTANLVMAAGVTVDGIDISEHAADADAHHARATAGDGIDVTGQAIAVDVTDLLGAGLSASANNFIVDQGYAFAWTAAHTHAGDVTFTGAARTITSDGGYNLTIGAAGDLVLDPTGNITLPNAQEMRTVDFSDLVTGISGLRLWDRGSNYRQLTMGAIKIDELYARVFVADEVRIDRGEEYWSKSYGIVETDFATPADEDFVNVWFEDAPGLAAADLFSYGDWLLFRTIDWGTGIVIAKYWMRAWDKVTADTTNKRQQWQLQLKSGTTGNTVKKGSLALDVGLPGQGWVHLSALEQDGGPFIQLGDWVTDPSVGGNVTNRVRMGNLNGVGGIATDTWGFAAAKNLGTAIGSGFNGIVIDPTNGVRLYNADLTLYDGATKIMRTGSGKGIIFRHGGTAGSLNHIIWTTDPDGTIDASNVPALIGSRDDGTLNVLELLSVGIGAETARVLVAADTTAYMYLDQATDLAYLTATTIWLDGAVKTSVIRAEDVNGLSLNDDGGNLGLFIRDGGGAATTSLRAYNANGLSLNDDGGNLGIFVEDGGAVGIANAAPDAPLHVGDTGGTSGEILVQSNGGRTITLEADDTGNLSHVGTQSAHYFNIVTNDVIRMGFATTADGAGITAFQELTIAPAAGAPSLQLTRAAVGSWSMYVNSSDGLVFGESGEADHVTISTAGLLTVAGGVNFGQDTLGYFEADSWTPTSGVTLAAATGRWVRIGPMVFAFFEVTFPSSASGTGAILDSLPFTCSNDPSTSNLHSSTIHYSDVACRLVPIRNTDTASFIGDGASTANLSYADMSGKSVGGVLIYRAP